MAKEKPKKNIWKRVLKILILTPVILFIAGVIFYQVWDNMPDIWAGFENKIQPGGPIEAKYLHAGNLETKKYTAKAEDPIKKYTVYYPTELENGEKSYPLLLVVNGTGKKATKYEPEFKNYASWGFIVVGNQDKGTGTGETTIKTLHYMLE